MTSYTDHPDYRSLLASVIANPADDLPRLVLADWIEEHGDTDRAVYIRCEVAVPVNKPRHCLTTGEALSSRGVVGPLFRCRCRCRTCATVRKAYMASRQHIHVDWNTEILVPGVGKWQQEFVASGYTMRVAVPHVHFLWSRGFVDEIRTDRLGLEYHGREVLANCPVGVIHLTDMRERWEIEAPGKGYGWQCYYHYEGQQDYYTMGGWEDREDMVDEIVRYVSREVTA